MQPTHLSGNEYEMEKTSSKAGNSRTGSIDSRSVCQKNGPLGCGQTFDGEEWVFGVQVVRQGFKRHPGGRTLLCGSGGGHIDEFHIAKVVTLQPRMQGLAGGDEPNIAHFRVAVFWNYNKLAREPWLLKIILEQLTSEAV